MKSFGRHSMNSVLWRHICVRSKVLRVNERQGYYMKIQLQHDQRDCGAACLSMIAMHYGLKYPISRYRELTKTDKIGTNIYGIVDGAKKIGLNANALSGSIEELIDGVEKGEIKFPFIAHISKEDCLHYVVVFGYCNGNFLIADPAKGKCSHPLDFFSHIWTGYIVTFEKTDSFSPGNHVRGNFLKFFLLLRGQYFKMTGVFFLSLLIALIGIFGAFVFEIVIDGFAVKSSNYQVSTIIEHTNNLSFHTIFIAVILLYLLQAVFQFVRGYLIASVSRKIDINLSLSYFNQIVDLPVSSISVRQTGEYLSRFSDTANIRYSISNATITLLLDAVMVIACGCILFKENRKLFTVSLLLIAIYLIIVIIYKKPVKDSNYEVMEKNAQLQSYFKESIDGIETVKAACANEKIKDITTSKFNHFINAVFKNSILAMSQNTLSDSIELIGTLMILWIGFGMVLNRQITIGSLITFYALLSYFIGSIKNLVELQPTIQSAIVSAERLNDILDLQCEEVHTTKCDLPYINTWNLQNISFRYGNGFLTLNNVNLSFRRGEKIAIVGESGSGKSSLVKLLLRFFEPEKGNILINNEDIKEYDLGTLRKNIAYVDQKVFLFSDTIKNNLILGNADVSDEEISRVCEICQLSEFIEKMPLGLSTPLDENGMNLSGGQRQRLAIARALIQKPQLLILDEATSNLDTITEASIKNAITDFDNNLTCIIIAHRLSTVKNCDYIYVMDNGQIIESGTHEQLLNSKEKYAKLWEMQLS